MAKPPTQPMNINSTSPRQTPDEFLSTSVSGRQGSMPGPGFGTPSSRPARTGTPSTPTIANIPLRGVENSPSPAGGLPGSFSGHSLRPRTPHSGGSTTPPIGDNPARPFMDDVSEEQMARVLRRHLVPRRTAEVASDVLLPNGPGESSVGSRRGSESGSSRSGQVVSGQLSEDEPFPIPYDAPGGDITHPIYKWEAGQRRNAQRPRANSFTAPDSEPVDSAFEHIREPGGFRRNYVRMRANEQGLEEPVVSNNFIEFLYLFGHFAGEDLEEEEEEEDEDEALLQEEGAVAGPSQEDPSLLKPDEQEPLLSKRGSKFSTMRSRRMARRQSIGPHGDATVTQAVLMLLKSFVGTGVLFLGKAFFNGGILFSATTLVTIALISLHSFLLLVKAKQKVPGSYGDIGGKLYGPWMRYAILSAVAVSQLGFVCAYTIFVSQNLQAFVLAITKCARLIPIQYFILLQLVVFLPLALIRNIAKLSSTALVADVFILSGLLYIFGSEIDVIAKNGIARVELFNPKDFPLLIGTAVFSFEGVGLVIPISDSMREPHKFPAVLTGVMFFLIALFGGAGVLAYLAFGPNVQTVVITNLNAESKLVQSVQFLYSVAILLSVPLQLFPAVRIMENGLFVKSGKANLKVKWQKNILRFVITIFCALVSWAGAGDLDKFVALVGSFACVPLCYVYPAMLHYKACARTRREKITDILLMVFGMLAAIYTTVQTISLMVAPSEGTPSLGQCESSSPLDGRV